MEYIRCSIISEVFTSSFLTASLTKFKFYYALYLRLNFLCGRKILLPTFSSPLT